MTVTLLIVLLHGSTGDAPMIFGRFPNTPACATASETLGRTLRTEYRDAVSYCYATGAPANSPAPRLRPIREARK